MLHVKSDQDLQTPTAPFLLHRVAVARRQVLSPGFVRITFGGRTLDRFADPGLDQRIKLILPAPDGSLDAMPFTDDWFPAWRALPDRRRPVIRTYTTRAVRTAEREVDVDLVLHEPCGPAGRFAAECVDGDRAVLLGPNTAAAGSAGGVEFRLPPSGAARVLIAGDETALPAIVRIVAALPPHVRGTVLVEVPHEADGAQLPVHPGVVVRVLVRGSAPTGTLLVPAVRRAADGRNDAPAQDLDEVDGGRGLLWEVPGGPCSAWLAGEAGVITALRRVLVAELGFDRRSVAFMGYWRAGSAEGG